MDPHYYEDDFGGCTWALLPPKVVLTRHVTLDLQNMVELVKFVRRLGETSPLSDIIGVAPSPTTPS